MGCRGTDGLPRKRAETVGLSLKARWRDGLAMPPTASKQLTRLMQARNKAQLQQKSRIPILLVESHDMLMQARNNAACQQVLVADGTLAR